MSFHSSLTPVRLFYDHYVPTNCNLELPAVIFFHGLASSHTAWNKVKRRIADNTRRRVFAVDLRNHGQSGRSDLNSLDAMVVDVENLMSLLKINHKAIFIGHSLGGKLACTIALQKPELVSKIILEESTLKNPEEDEKEKFLKAMRSLKQIHRLPKTFSDIEAQKFIARMVKDLFPEHPILNAESSFVPLRRDADGSFQFEFNADSLLTALEDGTLYSIDVEKYQSLSTPALFVYGGKSTIKIDEDDSILKYFPKAEFCNIKNGSHMPHSEFPDEFVESVCRFINAS